MTFIVSTPDGKYRATTPNGTALLTTDDCGCCGGDCFTGCGDVFVLALACPQSPYTAPSGHDCGAAVPPPPIAVWTGWSGFNRFPLGTVPTDAQLTETQVVLVDGQCYRLRKNVFCLADVPSSYADAYYSSLFSSSGSSGCPQLIPATLRQVRNPELVPDGCSDDRCQTRPEVIAYVPCAGVTVAGGVVYICANEAPGSAVVRLQAVNGQDLGCWCRTGESVLPPDARLFDGYVISGYATCCACHPGCSWYDDGTPGGCCCGKLDQASVQVNGTLTVVQTGVNGTVTYSYLAETIGQIPSPAANLAPSAQVRVTLVITANGTSTTQIGEVITPGFCGAPCPIGFFGLFGFPLELPPDFGGDCSSGSGTVTSQIPGGSNTASWSIQRQCGLSSITSNGSQSGLSDAGGGNYNPFTSTFNGQASISMRYNSAGCEGGCVGTSIQPSGAIAGLLP